MVASPPELVRHAMATYRYLRLGIVVAVFVLIAGLIVERIEAGCLKSSISAYFYSPVRSLLVGALVAIGLCLIAIRGRTDSEEVLLNLAGMFAPIVALVPTTPSRDDCPSPVATDPASTDAAPLPEWVTALIDNNVVAYFVVAGLVVVALIVWWVAVGRWRRTASWFLRSVLIYTGLVLAGSIGYLTSDRFKEYAHWLAAVAMFVCFFCVVVGSARRWRTDAPAYAAAYRSVWRAMILAALAIGGWKLLDDHASGFPTWDEEIYWLEIAEIFLFALFWGIQTWQFRADEPAAPR